MANEQNLRPPYTPSEAREYGEKGGKASGESKRKKKLIRDTIEIILSQEIKDSDMLKTMKVLGLSDHPSYGDYLVASIITRTAETGNISDLSKLADMLGENNNTDPAMLDEVKSILDRVPSVIDEEDSE